MGFEEAALSNLWTSLRKDLIPTIHRHPSLSTIFKILES